MSGEPSAFDAPAAQDAELFFHTHAPADNTEMLGLLMTSLVTAKRDWRAAHDAYDAEAEARAVAEWADATELLAVGISKMRDQRRTFELPPPITFVIEKPEGPASTIF